MKKRYTLYIFVAIVLSLVLLQFDYLNSKLILYVSKKAERNFGAKHLAEAQEKKIKAIAKKMGVFEPITIRKMNHKALASLGYHNAFAHFPALFDFIPVNTQPFLFVSEGFFEDLSSEEQLFLIGHEMVHIKERHTRYLKLVFYILLLGLFLFWLFLKKYFRFFGSAVFQNIVLCIFLVSPNLICLAYRRHIEREADYRSMEMLKSYDGGIKLIERWVREFNMPEHNPWLGFFSDHPSYAQRKACCLELKSKSESKT